MRNFLKIIVFFIPLFLISQTNSQLKEEYNFRKTVWGMTKESVKHTEKRKPVFDRENDLVYNDTLMSLNMGVFYHFVENKLVSSGYGVIEKHSNKNLYINDYKELKNVLLEKYGDPSDRWFDGEKYKEILWLNDLYKDNPSHWGFAISLGHLVYQSCWETDETEIVLKLNGDNYEIQLNLVYYSKKLKHLEEKEKEDEKLKNF
jgi:hypothetical protein